MTFEEFKNALMAKFEKAGLSTEYDDFDYQYAFELYNSRYEYIKKAATIMATVRAMFDEISNTPSADSGSRVGTVGFINNGEEREITTSLIMTNIADVRENLFVAAAMLSDTQFGEAYSKTISRLSYWVKLATTLRDRAKQLTRTDIFNKQEVNGVVTTHHPVTGETATLENMPARQRIFIDFLTNRVSFISMADVLSSSVKMMSYVDEYETKKIKSTDELLAELKSALKITESAINDNEKKNLQDVMENNPNVLMDRYNRRFETIVLNMSFVNVARDMWLSNRKKLGPLVEDECQRLFVAGIDKYSKILITACCVLENDHEFDNYIKTATESMGFQTFFRTMCQRFGSNVVNGKMTTRRGTSVEITDVSAAVIFVMCKLFIEQPDLELDVEKCKAIALEKVQKWLTIGVSDVEDFVSPNSHEPNEKGDIET